MAGDWHVWFILFVCRVATRCRPWRSRYFFTIWMLFISWSLRRTSLTPEIKTNTTQNHEKEVPQFHRAKKPSRPFSLRSNVKVSQFMPDKNGAVVMSTVRFLGVIFKREFTGTHGKITGLSFPSKCLRVASKLTHRNIVELGLVFLDQSLHICRISLKGSNHWKALVKQRPPAVCKEVVVKMLAARSSNGFPFCGNILTWVQNSNHFLTYKPQGSPSISVCKKCFNKTLLNIPCYRGKGNGCGEQKSWFPQTV